MRTTRGGNCIDPACEPELYQLKAPNLCGEGCIEGTCADKSVALRVGDCSYNMDFPTAESVVCDENGATIVFPSQIQCITYELSDTRENSFEIFLDKSNCRVPIQFINADVNLAGNDGIITVTIPNQLQCLTSTTSGTEWSINVTGSPECKEHILNFPGATVTKDDKTNTTTVVYPPPPPPGEDNPDCVQSVSYPIEKNWVDPAGDRWVIGCDDDLYVNICGYGWKKIVQKIDWTRDLLTVEQVDAIDCENFTFVTGIRQPTPLGDFCVFEKLIGLRELWLKGLECNDVCDIWNRMVAECDPCALWERIKTVCNVVIGGRTYISDAAYAGGMCVCVNPSGAAAGSIFSINGATCQFADIYGSAAAGVNFCPPGACQDRWGLASYFNDTGADAVVEIDARFDQIVFGDGAIKVSGLGIVHRSPNVTSTIDVNVPPPYKPIPSYQEQYSDMDTLYVIVGQNPGRNIIYDQASAQNNGPNAQSTSSGTIRFFVKAGEWCNIYAQSYSICEIQTASSFETVIHNGSQLRLKVLTPAIDLGSIWGVQSNG